MIEKIKALCLKHREILVYLIVGGLTTLVSWTAKFLWNFAFYENVSEPTVFQNTILSVVENAAGIAFAYPTNRKWVFQSKNPHILAEACSFVGSRLVTMLLGWLLNLLLTNALGVDMKVSTVIASVFVVVGNYVISKLLVFRKKNRQDPPEEPASPESLAPSPALSPRPENDRKDDGPVCD